MGGMTNKLTKLARKNAQQANDLVQKKWTQS